MSEIQKWEYNYVWLSMTDRHNSEANKFGLEGWEMCGIAIQHDTELMFYFKRQIVAASIQPPTKPEEKGEE